ncbi:MAG: dehydratase, partial [Actinomycetota bacterium]
IGGDGLIAWNYGLDKVRFPATVYLENRIRLRTTLEAAEGRGEGWLLRNLVTIDIEGSTRPAMVGGWLVMFTPNVG